MDDERYRGIPFAPWGSGAGARRQILKQLALVEQAASNCHDRAPTSEKRAALEWLAAHDEKLAGFCRQFEAAIAAPLSEQRSVEAARAVTKIRRWLGSLNGEGI
jgi:hypothetical protein